MSIRKQAFYVVWYVLLTQVDKRLSDVASVCLTDQEYRLPPHRAATMFDKMAMRFRQAARWRRQNRRMTALHQTHGA